MRTTLDIPDNVMKKAKMMAIDEGVPLKTIVARALQKEVTQPMDTNRPGKVRRTLEELRNISRGIQWNGPPEMSFWVEMILHLTPSRNDSNRHPHLGLAGQ